MKLTEDNSYSVPILRQEYVIPINWHFHTPMNPLILPSPTILNSTTNLSFSICPNSTAIFNPPNVQTMIGMNQNFLLGSEGFINRNLQKTQSRKLQNQDLEMNQRHIFQDKQRNYEQTVKRNKVIQKPSQRCKQDPKRNIVTNIGNQLLTFTTNKSKCMKVLETLKKVDQKEITGFFSYTNRLRSRIGYYLNYAKMKNIWYPKQLNPNCQNYQKTLRTVSYFYLTQIFMPIVLNSSKIKKNSKNYHIKAIRKLIKDIRNPPKPH